VNPSALPAEFGAGTIHLPPLVVWALLTGSGFTVLFFTGLLAWWLHRRADRAERYDRRESRTAASARARALPTEMAELQALRSAAARAATVAAHARHDSDRAAKALEAAEHEYEQARREHFDARSSAPRSTPTDSDAERDVARAALGAYRRGDLTSEDLRKVWYGAGGWDDTRDAAEQESLRFGAQELAARQEYHRALRAAQAARRAEYIAETAARALAAEAVVAADELGWHPPAPRRANGRRTGPSAPVGTTAAPVE
jgi:hypothetical protein